MPPAAGRWRSPARIQLRPSASPVRSSRICQQRRRPLPPSRRHAAIGLPERSAIGSTGLFHRRLSRFPPRLAFRLKPHPPHSECGHELNVSRCIERRASDQFRLPRDQHPDDGWPARVAILRCFKNTAREGTAVSPAGRRARRSRERRLMRGLSGWALRRASSLSRRKFSRLKACEYLSCRAGRFVNAPGFSALSCGDCHCSAGQGTSHCGFGADRQ